MIHQPFIINHNASLSGNQTCYRLFLSEGYFVLKQIKVKDNAVELANTRMYINPFCEIAVQEAVNLKKNGAIK